MPENDPPRPVGAPPVLDDRRAALGLPPLGEGGAAGWRARVEAVADAMGTTAARLAAGVVVGVLVLGAVGWTLVAAPGGGSGRVDDASLPRASPSASAARASAARASPPTSMAAEVVVDAAGAVVRPGVYRLGPSVRVSDVVAAAGGPAPDADLDLVNLAAPVSDGERVYVPHKGESPPAGAGAAAGASPAQPVNLNSATAEQLDALPGVGPATARAIVAWRQQHGRFSRVDDLLKVRGIGPAKLDALRSEVRV